MPLELYEGASYRINIQGYDSTTIVDSYMGVVRADIRAEDETILVDNTTKTLRGTFVGDIADTDGNIVYDPDNNTLQVQNIYGNVLDINNNVLIDYETGTIRGNIMADIIDQDGGVVLNTTESILRVDYIYGNIVDNTNTVLVDYETGTFTGNLNGNVSGNLVGAVLKNNGETILNPDLELISNVDFAGSLINNEGTYAYDRDSNVFKGTFHGEFVDTSGNVVIDSNTSILKLDLQGNIFGSQGELAYDYTSNTFTGNFFGTFYNDAGDVVIDNGVYQGALLGDIVDASGGLAFDSNTNTFIGNFVGSVYNSLGDAVFDTESNTVNSKLRGNLLKANNTTAYDFELDTMYTSLVGNVYSVDGAILLDSDLQCISASLVDMNGNVAYDHLTKQFVGDFVGNFFDTEGEPIFVADNKCFVGNLLGDVVSNDGSILIDSTSNTFTGTLQGDLYGNLYDSTGEIIFNNESLTWYETINGSFVGNFSGDFFNLAGDIIYDNDNNTLNSQYVDTSFLTADDANIQNFIVNTIFCDDGSVFANTQTSEIFADLRGDIYSNDSSLAYSYQTNTFYGNVEGVVKGKVSAKEITALDNDLVVNFFGGNIDESVKFKTFSSDEDFAQIMLSRGRGTLANPEPLQLGDLTNGIVFAGVESVEAGQLVESIEDVPLGTIFAEVDPAGVIANGKLPGKITCGTFNTDTVDENFNIGWTVDSNGDFSATIKDLTVKGETGNAPVNTSTPSKWLEMVVNGETVYMPLYS